MIENELSKVVFDLGLKIHKKFGAGLFESVYEECLFYELKKAGLKVERFEIRKGMRMHCVVRKPMGKAIGNER